MLGTGCVRFDEGPLIHPAPMSAQPVDQVLSSGPPASCATTFSCWSSSRLVPPLCLSLLSLPSLPTGLLRKNWQTSVKIQEKLQTQLSEQRVKVAEEERVLERMQADLVGLVGEASDRDEYILELRRKVSVVPEPEDMDASDGSTPRPVLRKRSKARAPKGKKVKISTDSPTKILKLAQSLSHGDLLKWLLTQGLMLRRLKILRRMSRMQRMRRMEN